METVGRGRDRVEGLVPRGHGCSREDRDGRPLRMVQVEQRNLRLRKAGLLNLEGELAVTLRLTLTLCMSLTRTLCLLPHRSLTLKPNRNIKQNVISLHK